MLRHFVHLSLAAVFLRFDVKHSGAPVSIETLRALFDPYTPVALNLVREYGSSLALAIAQKHVTLLGGAMSANIESTKHGVATVVSFVVPLRVAAPSIKSEEVPHLPVVSQFTSPATMNAYRLLPKPSDVAENRSR